jgi:hypothetical protein
MALPLDLEPPPVLVSAREDIIALWDQLVNMETQPQLP